MNQSKFGDFSDFSSFREVDESQQQTKGWAFKRFKALESSLLEGDDYIWLEQQTHAMEIEALRQAGRIYQSTVNLVLLSPNGKSKVIG